MADSDNKKGNKTKTENVGKSIFAITKAKSNNTKQSKMKNTKPKQSFRKYAYRYSGFLLVVCATIYLTCSYFLIKLAKSLNASEMGSIKFFVTFLFSGIAALFWKQNLLGPKESRMILTLRGLCGSIALILNYFSLQYINYSDSTVIRNLSPLMTALFATVFLKESMNISHLFAGMVTLIGLLFILRPAFAFGMLSVKSSNIDNNWQFYLGIGLALLSTVFFGMAFVFIKKLAKVKVHFSVCLFYLSSIGFLLSVLNSVVLYFTGNSYQDFQVELVYIKRDAGIAVLAGVVNFFGHFCLSMASVSENSNKISLMRFLDIAVAFALEYAVIRVMPDLFSISGASFIVASLLILFIYKLIVNKSQEIVAKEQKKKQKAIYRI
jgi:drug/metabolite transporter (DMT)-like permease